MKIRGRKITMDRKIVPIMVAIFFITSTAVFADSVQLPRTGQTKCYTASGMEIACIDTGQDGETQAGVAWPSPRFAVSGDCVTDNLTGLMWSKNANLPSVTKTWTAALGYVAGMNSSGGLCGFKDWRLPNINELQSLVNADKPDIGAWLVNLGFTNVQPYYWSSTTSAYYTGNAWYVGMYVGEVYCSTKSYNIYVWPVRAGQCGASGNSAICLPKTGQTTGYYAGDDGMLKKGIEWPAPRFKASGDCVTDNLTGLVWSKNASQSGAAMTWQGALDYVADINSGGLCGYKDWRLPNREELLSLVDHSKYNPALLQNHPFSNVQASYYWSSTTYAYDMIYAWVVDIYNGYADDYYKSFFNYVWPVRSGSSVSSINNCTATLSADFELHVPIITYNSQSYSADFQYSQGSDFTLINASKLTDTSSFSKCTVSTLSSDFKLHMPTVTYNGVSYWADLQYVSKSTFKLIGAGQE